jgi:hypothetical protein
LSPGFSQQPPEGGTQNGSANAERTTSFDMTWSPVQLRPLRKLTGRSSAVEHGKSFRFLSPNTNSKL